MCIGSNVKAAYDYLALVPDFPENKSAWLNQAQQRTCGDKPEVPSRDIGDLIVS